MNCQNFEAVVVELAEERAIEALVRQRALGHVRTCPRCAQRLDVERALAAGFRALAMKSLIAEKAPARVKESLRLAFRERTGTFRFHPPIVHTPSRQWSLSRWALGMAAAVAAVILLYSLALQVVAPRETQGPVSGVRGPVPAREPLREPQQMGVQEPDRENLQAATGSGIKAPAPVSSPAASPKPRLTSRPALRRAPAAGAYRVAQPITPAESEIATDFLPLTYDTGAVLSDGGRIVRVELPRSALVSFGLPVNMESAGGRIKADVLLGEDGLARAIRFVH